MQRWPFSAGLWAFFVSLVVSITCSYFSLRKEKVIAPVGSGHYETVLKRGTIRCAYFLSPPLSQMDPNTKQLSGIGIALMEKIANNANLKAEWVEEVQFGTMIAGLQSGRYDAICTPAWADAARAREALFGIPLFYAAIGAWVRHDDQRLHNISDIDSPTVTIAVMDGDVTQSIANENFPNARQLSFPGNALAGELLQAVISRKADVAFEDIIKVMRFQENNPETLMNVAIHQPLRIYPLSLAVNKDDWQLMALLNVSAQTLINSGDIDRLIDTYDRYKDGYLRAAVAYR